ncbi:MAG TPA: hypothetical protein VF818_02300, partial [Ktedonobacterales bacterium]
TSDESARANRPRAGGSTIETREISDTGGRAGAATDVASHGNEAPRPRRGWLAVAAIAAVVLLLVGVMQFLAPLRHHPAPAATPTTVPTPRPLRQTFVYFPGDITVNGVPNARQTPPGATLSVGWTARAYSQSADITPITLSLLVYGPFASETDLMQRMHLDGHSPTMLGATPPPVAQLPMAPVATAPPIRTDTWTTTPFTTTLRLPTTLPAGYYDIVVVSVAGTQTVMRGDSPLQVTR